MEYVNDINIQEAVIHILDSNSPDPILNEFTLELTEDIYKFLYKKYSNFKFKKNSNKLLNSLDVYKKTIVYMLYKEDNNTSELPLNDGAVVFLEHWMVIQKAASQYAVEDLINPRFPYFLQPWVVDKLNKDENLLLSFKKAAEQQLKNVEYN